MSTNAGPSPVVDRLRRRAPVPVDRADAVLAGLVVVAAVAGVALRMVLTRTPMWLDEAQTVAVARLPLADIPAALLQEGHPPLYYALLHLWMRVFGEGDAAVRSLSVVFGLAGLAPLVAIARRVGGRPTAQAALVLAATSPFLVRYATEARMYALVIALALAWWLAVQRSLEVPSLGRLATVAVLVAALLLTHYWSAFLLVAGAVPLGRRLLRGGPPARTAQLVAAAHLVGAMAFVPWVPSLLTQLRRTGTPWAEASDPPTAALYALVDFAGGLRRPAGVGLFAALVVLLLLGTLGRSLGRRRIELDLSVPGPARPVATLVAVTAAAGLGLCWLTGAAFVSRYFAVLVGFVLLLAARGVAQLDRVLQVGVVAVVGAMGLAGSWQAVNADRSQGAQVAEVVADWTAEDDEALVVACPDQLGPAVARYLPDNVEAVGYPLLTPAGRVDWTDYAERNEAANPRERANRIVNAAGGADVWLVWHAGYLTFDRQCELLRWALSRQLGEPVDVVVPRGVYEPMRLTRFRGLD